MQFHVWVENTPPACPVPNRFASLVIADEADSWWKDRDYGRHVDEAFVERLDRNVEFQASVCGRSTLLLVGSEAWPAGLVARSSPESAAGLGVTLAGSMVWVGLVLQAKSTAPLARAAVACTSVRNGDTPAVLPLENRSAGDRRHHQRSITQTHISVCSEVLVEYGGVVTDRACAAVLAVLPVGVDANVGSRGDESVISIGRQRLLACWIGDGHLRDVRRFLDSKPDGSAVVVAAARVLSPGAVEALRQAGVGFVDETGAAEIAAGPIVVSRTGVKARPDGSPKRWVGSVFSVAEALLCGVDPTVHACADATGMSVGSATNALAALVEFGLLGTDHARGPRSGRRVEDRVALLDAYQAALVTVRAKPSISVGVAPGVDVVDEVARAGKAWDSSDTAWAATGVVAAAVMAPLLTQVSTGLVYVGESNAFGLHKAAETAGLRPIEGGRLTLACFPTVASDTMATRVEELRVAPWPRVYVDLASLGVRGEEAAEHLREIVE